MVDGGDGVQIDAGGSGLSAAAVLRFGGVICRIVRHNGLAGGIRQASKSGIPGLFEVGGDGGDQSFGLLLPAIQGIFDIAGAGSSAAELDLADSNCDFIGGVFETEVKRQKYFCYLSQFFRSVGNRHPGGFLRVKMGK